MSCPLEPVGNVTYYPVRNCEVRVAQFRIVEVIDDRVGAPSGCCGRTRVGSNVLSYSIGVGDASAETSAGVLGQLSGQRVLESLVSIGKEHC